VQELIDPAFTLVQGIDLSTCPPSTSASSPHREKPSMNLTTSSDTTFSMTRSFGLTSVPYWIIKTIQSFPLPFSTVLHGIFFFLEIYKIFQTKKLYVSNEINITLYSIKI